MQCIVVGHGWHDGTTRIVVPDGVQLDFFTREDTPMLMTNLLALVSRGDLGIPMDSAGGGRDLPNYEYGSFTDEQLARVLQLERVEVDMFFVGSADLPTPGALCTDPAACPVAGPHHCAGILGFAAQRGYTHVQILACRIDTSAPQGPTHEIMGDDGLPSSQLDDEFTDFVQRFLGMSPKEQDDEWASLPYNTKVYLASDGEIAEWAEAYEARLAMQGTDPEGAAGVLAALGAPIRLRLLRDYPEYRHLLQDNVALSEAEQRWVSGEFLPLDFETQVALWRSLTDEQQLRYLSDPAVASWAGAYNAWDYFTLGMAPEPLAHHIAQLDVHARAYLRQRNDVRNHLGAAHGWALD